MSLVLIQKLLKHDSENFTQQSVTQKCLPYVVGITGISTHLGFSALNVLTHKIIFKNLQNSGIIDGVLSFTKNFGASLAISIGFSLIRQCHLTSSSHG